MADAMAGPILPCCSCEVRGLPLSVISVMSCVTGGAAVALFCTDNPVV